MYFPLTNINFWSAICGFVGTLMLFFYGLPPSLNKVGHIHLILEQTDKQEAKKYKLFKILSYVALGLISFSFLLEIINIVGIAKG